MQSTRSQLSRLSTNRGKVNFNFKDGAWSGQFTDLAIFDSTFIHENVYAGDFVDRDHKRALHNVIVGRQGVTDAAAIADLDSRIKQVTKRIGELEAQLRPWIPAGYDLKAFVALKDVDALDEQIAEMEAEAAAAARVSELVSKATLTKLASPKVPTGFPELLGKELGELSKNAEESVRDHRRSHTKGATERWLAEGLDFTKDAECPFCQQQVESLELVGAYRAYFGASYRALKTDIASMSSSFDTEFGEDVLLGIQRNLTGNAALMDFWQDFTTLEPFALDFDGLRRQLLALRTTGKGRLATKQQAPLEPLPVDHDLQSALDGLSTAQKSIVAYNTKVDDLNLRVETRKREVKASDSAVVNKKLTLLKATKVRTNPDVDRLCIDLGAAANEKKTLEVAKKAAKEKLDTYTEHVFFKYQGQINALLEQFGADFRLANTARSYVGGTASSEYQLVINDIPVALGGPDAPIGTTSFRNTLSAGDRSTLALAFFLAQLDLDPDLGKKIVILDDPFTSQDRSRRMCTQQLIRRKSRDACQVVVLSHDADFLKLLWEGYDSATVKTLQLARTDRETALRAWDIRAETLPAHYQDQIKLREFATSAEGDRRDVVRCIRPVLEGHMRQRAYPDFKPNEWLGDIITNIRNSTPTDSLGALKPMLAELEDINDFSKKYHHRDNPTGHDTEPIDDGELLTYVKRTLAFVAS